VISACEIINLNFNAANDLKVHGSFEYTPHLTCEEEIIRIRRWYLDDPWVVSSLKAALG